MIVLIIGIIMFIISILLIIYSFSKQKKISQLNQSIIDKNKQIEFDNLQLTTKKQELENSIENEMKKLTAAQETADRALESSTLLSTKAFENYCNLLENKYSEKEEEFNTLSETLDKAYSDQQEKILSDIAKVQNELDKIKSTRAALIEAQIKEKEIQEKLDFYCLRPTLSDKDDISKLDRIKPDLHNPRVLSMLIWQTFFQKNMTTLCNNVLGAAVVTGIYKITNINNGMCYIGQAVDVAKRWKDHAKCGLGIDTPTGNKLYAAIEKDGIWNFSWELLEACSADLLDEKEKYYISLYQSKEFGYNTTKGNH